jgi:hypothetical protein
MVPHENVAIGDKLPGHNCQLCGEIGLRKMVFGKKIWAVCPMVDGEPVVTKLAQAHTAYIIGDVVASSEQEEDEQEVEFEASPSGDNTNEEIDNG